MFLHVVLCHKKYMRPPRLCLKWHILTHAHHTPDAADCVGSVTADWDVTLKDLWQELQSKTGKMTGKQVQDNSEVATAASCSLLVSIYH